MLDKGSYFDLATLDAGSDVAQDSTLRSSSFGVHVVYRRRGVKNPLRREIDEYNAPNTLKVADQLHDLTSHRSGGVRGSSTAGAAAFMPKALFGENRWGMHATGRSSGLANAFYDADDQYFLSDVGRAFIAGRCGTRANLVGLRTVGELLRGAGTRYEAPSTALVAARPLGARSRAALPPRQGAGRADRVRCPDPASNPFSPSRCCLPRASRGSSRAMSCPSR